MNTTSLHIQIEPTVKQQAQKTADELGLSLSSVVKALLKQFIRTKQLSVGINERPESMAFTAVLLVSNVAAQKLFAFGPFTFTGGIIVFPISYIFGDVLTEVYGYARTRRVIWMGFVCSAFMALVLFISVKLPPAEGWPFQREFATVFELVPRIVAASLLAYWAGEFCNSYVLAKIKVLMEGKYLWVRTISSTIGGQAIDTSMFVMVSFLGILPASVIIQTIISGYLFKGLL
jgi:queuosine precursor transporter